MGYVFWRVRRYVFLSEGPRLSGVGRYVIEAGQKRKMIFVLNNQNKCGFTCNCSVVVSKPLDYSDATGSIPSR